MLHSKERMVLFFDLRLEAWGGSPRYPIHGLDPLPLRTLMKLIEALHLAEGFSKPSAANTATTYLADMHLARKYVVLLINFSDSLAADPAFSNPRTRQRREVLKREGEGNDYSAHVLIYLDPLPDKPDTYLMLLEQAPGLSSVRVVNFLKYLIRRCSSKDDTPFLVPHPDGTFDKNDNPVMIKLRHKLDAGGHPSTFFQKELNEGRLLGVELVTERFHGRNWDEKAYSVEQRRSIALSPRASSHAQNWFAAVKSMAKKGASQKYETARVRFKTKNGILRGVEQRRAICSQGETFRLLCKTRNFVWKNSYRD